MSFDSQLEDMMNDLRLKSQSITENTIKELHGEMDQYLIRAIGNDRIYATTNTLGNAKEKASKALCDFPKEKLKMGVYKLVSVFRD